MSINDGENLTYSINNIVFLLSFSHACILGKTVE